MTIKIYSLFTVYGETGGYLICENIVKEWNGPQVSIIGTDFVVDRRRSILPRISGWPRVQLNEAYFMGHNVDLQYILRNMHTVLLCFALLWLCNRS